MFIPDLPLEFMIPWGLFTLVHSLAFFSATPLATIITRDSFYFLSMMILIVCMIISLIFIRLMPKRTEYGSTMLGKIKGFKNFLLHAEKPKLEELVMEVWYKGKLIISTQSVEKVNNLEKNFFVEVTPRKVDEIFNSSK